MPLAIPGLAIDDQWPKRGAPDLPTQSRQLAVIGLGLFSEYLNPARCTMIGHIQAYICIILVQTVPVLPIRRADQQIRGQVDKRRYGYYLTK